MEAEFFEQRKQNFGNGPIEYLNLAGIKAEVMEERHVRFVLPLEPRHLNHVGIAYAGSEFVIAESAGGNLFVCTYGSDKYAPIIKGCECKYLKPTKKDLVVDISLSAEEAAEKIKPIEERGRGDFFLDIPVMDADGEHVAQFNFNFYAIPLTKDFAGSK
jgi:acyl-coenzyme A thioesterase PaaI-like protein